MGGSVEISLLATSLSITSTSQRYSSPVRVRRICADRTSVAFQCSRSDKPDTSTMGTAVQPKSSSTATSTRRDKRGFSTTFSSRAPPKTNCWHPCSTRGKDAVNTHPRPVAPTDPAGKHRQLSQPTNTSHGGDAQSSDDQRYSICYVQNPDHTLSVDEQRIVMKKLRIYQGLQDGRNLAHVL